MAQADIQRKGAGDAGVRTARARYGACFEIAGAVVPREAMRAAATRGRKVDRLARERVGARRGELDAAAHADYGVVRVAVLQAADVGAAGMVIGDRVAGLQAVAFVQLDRVVGHADRGARLRVELDRFAVVIGGGRALGGGKAVSAARAARSQVDRRTARSRGELDLVAICADDEVLMAFLEATNIGAAFAVVIDDLVAIGESVVFRQLDCVRCYIDDRIRGRVELGFAVDSRHERLQDHAVRGDAAIAKRSLACDVRHVDADCDANAGAAGRVAGLRRAAICGRARVDVGFRLHCQDAIRGDGARVRNKGARSRIDHGDAYRAGNLDLAAGSFGRSTVGAAGAATFCARRIGLLVGESLLRRDLAVDAAGFLFLGTFGGLLVGTARYAGLGARVVDRNGARAERHRAASIQVAIRGRDGAVGGNGEREGNADARVARRRIACGSRLDRAFVRRADGNCAGGRDDR